MLNTKHEITIIIDEVPFEITVKKMTQEQLDTHNAKFANLSVMAKEHDDLAKRMKRLQDRYQFNCELGNSAEALKVLDELEALEKTKPVSYSSAKEVFDMVEAANEARFMMTVSGNDKQKLVSVLKEKRISYLAINTLIDKKVEESQAGK